jgi:hypothetical protein
MMQGVSGIRARGEKVIIDPVLSGAPSVEDASPMVSRDIAHSPQSHREGSRTQLQCPAARLAK